ncbi:MAG: trypsin-like serine protease [Planctomycetales bacterium]|nr:trypsin-like serine protease [Planctomycetales bacterium]
MFALIGVEARAGLVHDPSITPELAYLNFAAQFPSVGWLFGQNNGVDAAFGSGVLIHPNFVLTAAHLALEVDNNPATTYDSYDFGVGSNFSNNPGESHISYKAFVHPDYISFGNGPDLALLYFEVPFTSVNPPAFYGGAVAVGDQVSIAGYGEYGTPSIGLQGYDGNRRAGSNYIDAIDSPNGYFDTRLRRPINMDFNPLGILVTPGDSGGGWFVEVGGEFQLAGITSFWGGTPLYNGTSSATYLTHEIGGWIKETQSAAVPEPSAFLFFTILISVVGVYKGTARWLPGQRSKIVG